MTIKHPPAYTAMEIAAAAHVPGKELAKTVIVKLDGKMTMAVLPSKYRVDLERLRTACRAGSVELATEEDFVRTFPNCDEGAMPPFGNLYDMDVYVAARLSGDEYIAFNAGTHTELVRMRYRDFERLVNPKVLAFAR